MEGTEPITYRVLGPVTALLDGHHVGLGGKRQRMVLATLIANRSSVVSQAALMEAVWNGEGPVRGPRALHTYVSNLRKILNGAIARDGGGYVLSASAESIDAGRFDAYVARGRAQLATSPAEAARLLQLGLGLWTGPAYGDLGSEPALVPEVNRLAAARLDAAELRFEAELLLGHSAHIVSELEALLRQEPFRERLVSLLMLALYRSGRPVDALHVYRRVRANFIEELGIEPGPELQQLELRIIERDPALASEIATDSGGPGDRGSRDRSVVAAGGNVPRPASRFVGRGAEIEEVSKLIQTERLVSLVGPGGIGKTRLAFEVLGQLEPAFSGGTWVVDVSLLRDGSSLPNAVVEAMALNLPEGVSVADYLIDALNFHPTLIILDTCEHLVRPVAAFVDDLLNRCPSITLLVTSRERLATDTEVTWMVRPLVEAADLFIDRVQRLDRSLSINEEQRATVERICQRLGGNPLAIELVSGRTPLYGFDGIESALEDVVSLPATGAGPDLAERHQDLRTTVRWSYDLLSNEEQTLFDRLSIFPHNFDLPAATRVCADIDEDPNYLLAHMEGLIGKSMLDTIDTANGRRFQQLDIVRGFASAQLQDSDKPASWRLRHAAYYTDWAWDRLQELPTVKEPNVRRQFATERPNLLAALRTLLQADQIADAVRLIVATHHPLEFVFGRQPLQVAHDVLRRDDARRDPLYPEACGRLARLYTLCGDVDAALQLIDDGVAAAEATGVSPHPHLFYNRSMMFAHDPPSMLIDAEEGYGLALDFGDPPTLILAAGPVTNARERTGDADGALRARAKALQLSVETHNPSLSAFAHWLWAQGEPDPARKRYYFDKAVDYAKDAGDGIRFLAQFHRLRWLVAHDPRGALGSMASLSRSLIGDRTWWGLWAAVELMAVGLDAVGSIEDSVAVHHGTPAEHRLAIRTKAQANVQIERQRDILGPEAFDRAVDRGRALFGTLELVEFALACAERAADVGQELDPNVVHSEWE